MKFKINENLNKSLDEAIIFKQARRLPDGSIVDINGNPLHLEPTSNWGDTIKSATSDEEGDIVDKDWNEDSGEADDGESKKKSDKKQRPKRGKNKKKRGGGGEMVNLLDLIIETCTKIVNECSDKNLAENILQKIKSLRFALEGAIRESDIDEIKKVYGMMKEQAEGLIKVANNCKATDKQEVKEWCEDLTELMAMLWDTLEEIIDEILEADPRLRYGYGDIYTNQQYRQTKDGKFVPWWDGFWPGDK